MLHQISFRPDMPIQMFRHCLWTLHRDCWLKKAKTRGTLDEFIIVDILKSCSFWLCVWSHVCVDAITASLPYLALTSDSCLVLLPYVCSPFRHSLIKTSAVSSESCSINSALPRNFAALSLCRVSPLSPSSIHQISHALGRLSDTSDCAGVRSDQTCRRRLYAHSDTQRRTKRQRVPLV